MDQYLASLIPEQNRVDLSFAHGAMATQLWETVYSPVSSFIGVFINDESQPGWARRAARYLDEDFIHNTPGKKKLFSDVLSSLSAAADDGCYPNFKPALDAFHAGERQGVKPYATSQDFGSCVDASASEHMTALFGWRAAKPEYGERYIHPAAWYWYADRGYCSDGWNGSGIAAVALRSGCAFRTTYQIGSNTVDFTNDDQNERIVARTWCRTGIPSWLKSHTLTNHPFEDGAITRFDGGLAELKTLFAAGGVLHTSGTRTSGGSRPFSIGSVGPHMQSAVGMDGSERYRQFCRDKIGVTLKDDDFAVVMNQTWGGGWSGECADQYWPEWWGHKPQGAWVWKASDVLNRLSCDYAWLPRVTGFAGTPVPPVPTPIPAHPPITGQLRTEQLPAGKVVIRGEVTLTTERAYQYIAVPRGSGFVLVPKPQV